LLRLLFDESFVPKIDQAFRKDFDELFNLFTFYQLAWISLVLADLLNF
jgi:hypothetical protein